MTATRRLGVLTVFLCLLASRSWAQPAPCAFSTNVEPLTPQSSSATVQKDSLVHARWTWVGFSLVAAGAVLEGIGHHGDRPDVEHNKFTLSGAALAGAGVAVVLTSLIQWSRHPSIGPIRRAATSEPHWDRVLTQFRFTSQHAGSNGSNHCGR